MRLRTCMMFYVLNLLCIWTGFCSEDPIVKTKYGAVRGITYERSDGGVSDVFLNIPYAKAPIDELRFEKPKEVEAWQGILDGTKYGASCAPHNKTVPVPPYSEDCLTLGITRPRDAKPDAKLPVLVWIHGGGYSIGSASLYSYKGLANIYNPNDIITVQIQYRLGFMGFLSDGDTMPGNLGIWDQIQSLRFIQEVIGDFGGHKDQVTLFGLSAGAASVSQLALSPHTTDLFQRTIVMSATASASWSFADQTLNHSRQLAEAVGCPFGNNFKSCVKAKPLDEFYSAVDNLGSTHYSLNLLKWNPRVDGDLFPARPEILVQTAPKRPTILGMALKESLFFAILGWTKSLHRFEIAPQDFDSYDEDRFRQALRDLVATPEYYGDKAEMVFEKVFNEYGKDTGDRGFYLEMYAKIISDLTFNVALARDALLRTQYQLPTYLYLTEHFNKVLYPEHYPVKGATHVCEYPYILDMFTLGKFDIEGDEVEKRIAKTFRQSFASFIKTGVPTNEVTEWKPTSESDPLRYLHITSEPHMSSGVFKHELDFWNRIAEETGYDVTTFTATKSSNRRDDEL